MNLWFTKLWINNVWMDFFNMTQPITLANKWFSTLITAKWTITRMGSTMRHKMTLRKKYTLHFTNFIKQFSNKIPFDMKSFGHKSHWKFRSALIPLLWHFWWNNKFPLSGNDLPHSSHAYGRSPVWHRLINKTIIKQSLKSIYKTYTSCDWLNVPFL